MTDALSAGEGEVAHLEVVRLSVGPLQANAYLLLSDGEAVVVDPGGDGALIAAELERRGALLTGIWLTHAHFDHVAGLKELLETAPMQDGPAPVHMHPADAPVLEEAVRSAARWSIVIDEPPRETVDIEHGDTLTVGRVSARALHTPGHAPGHVAFHLPGHGLVLSGDALFQGSIGRTDIPFGDQEQLLGSIRRELLALHDETTVLPGHGGATSIGAERYGNPFL